MLDIDLLQSFVAVVECRSFTRAAERVHRTQSTVSQQIRKLEISLGTELLTRTTAIGQVSLTDDGEQLLPYAQRILSTAREAEDVMRKRPPETIIRLGLPEDFRADQLTDLLTGFATGYPSIRVDTMCGLTSEVEPLLQAGDLDLALMKREVGSGQCVERWPEELVWVGASSAVARVDPVPLAVFPSGCLYRARAIHALEAQGRRWRIAYASASLTGILAAVSSGLAITLLARAAVPADLKVLNKRAGLAAVAPTEVALVAREPVMSVAVRRLAEYVAGKIHP